MRGTSRSIKTQMGTDAELKENDKSTPASSFRIYFGGCNDSAARKELCGHARSHQPQKEPKQGDEQACRDWIRTRNVLQREQIRARVPLASCE